MSLLVRNPWTQTGGSLMEAQRKDLWVVDFSSMVKGLQQYSGWQGRTFAPDPNSISYYATSVSIPDMQVGVKSFPGLSAPINYPDMDEALGQIRIQFIVDANSSGTNSVGVIHNLLEAWRVLARGGRDSFSNEFVPILSAELNYQFIYQYPVRVTLYQGNQSAPDIFNKTLSTDGLIAGATYFFENMWCAGYQIGELTYTDGNAIHIITGSFYASTILSAAAGQGSTSGATLSDSTQSTTSSAVTLSNLAGGTVSASTPTITPSVPSTGTQTTAYSVPDETSYEGNLPDDTGQSAAASAPPSDDDMDPLGTPGQTAANATQLEAGLAAAQQQDAVQNQEAGDQ